MNIVEFWRHRSPTEYCTSLVMKMKDYEYSDNLMIWTDPSNHPVAAWNFLKALGVKVSLGDAFIIVDSITGKREAFVLFANTEFLPVEVRNGH